MISAVARHEELFRTEPHSRRDILKHGGRLCERKLMVGNPGRTLQRIGVGVPFNTDNLIGKNSRDFQRRVFHDQVGSIAESCRASVK